jgi:hypothetical protein
VVSGRVPGGSTPHNQSREIIKFMVPCLYNLNYGLENTEYRLMIETLYEKEKALLCDGVPNSGPGASSVASSLELGHGTKNRH